jgi:hypothetical protein
MSIVNNTEGFLFIAQNGRLGRPNGVGLIKAGWSRYGEWFAGAGIYRRDGRWHKQRIVKCVHYKCQNPQTTNQQIWRVNFTNGVSAFHALDASQVAMYKKLGSKIGRTGFNYFMSRYLRNLL